MEHQSTRLRDLPPDVILNRCKSGRLQLDYGAATARLRCTIANFAASVRLVYGGFHAQVSQSDFSDYHIRLRRSLGLRAILRKQSRFQIDGIEPFEPFPIHGALPLFEWGFNWSFSHRGNQFLLLHAGALAREGRAIIMAAPPGSGKSTLAAAMMLRGFHLLSDEFGVLDPETGNLRAMLKPVALKNQSVELIREFSPDAVIGPLFTGTHKGDVAHLAPNDVSVDAIHRPAPPALVLFPEYRPDASLSVQRLPDEEAFARLAFNSFNYHLLGPIGFEAVANVIESCPAYKLRYSDLDQAIEGIGELLDEASERRAADTA
jgi:HprK-related kinase A